MRWWKLSVLVTLPSLLMILTLHLRSLVETEEEDPRRLTSVAWTNKKRHGRGEADVLRGQVPVSTPPSPGRPGSKRSIAHKPELPACLKHLEGARMRDLHLWTALEAEKLQMRVAGPFFNRSLHSHSKGWVSRGMAMTLHKELMESLNKEGVPSFIPQLVIKDHSGGAGLRIHFDDPALLTVLPQKDRSWRYRTCAVVGNSGQLLRAEAGAEIDQHDAVFRINYAPTAGFEAHVGNRTTFDIINQQHAKVFVPEVHGGGSLPLAIRADSRDSTVVMFEIDKEFPRKRLYAPIMQLLGDRVVVLSPELVLHTQWMYDRILHILKIHMPPSQFASKGWSAKKAMSGWFAVFFSFQVCKKVSLYGISPYTTMQEWWQAKYHYFDETPAADSHAFDVAYEMFKQIARWPCTDVELEIRS
ncbi:glycosyltransferase 29 protein [Cymbomonas tetramitiformis]|uniref:Glycosyltransferase 29 protein n=1 Tax=Cymbomonas tetramitiformis TaxID=36881 RepID=A0AAE0BNT9_9CHLO|nr:glycosyltransferase 29 protein [Cymbomonas tetramitiformis]